MTVIRQTLRSTFWIAAVAAVAFSAGAGPVAAPTATRPAAVATATRSAAISAATTSPATRPALPTRVSDAEWNRIQSILMSAERNVGAADPNRQQILAIISAKRDLVSAFQAAQNGDLARAARLESPEFSLGLHLAVNGGHADAAVEQLLKAANSPKKVSLLLAVARQQLALDQKDGALKTVRAAADQFKAGSPKPADWATAHEIANLLRASGDPDASAKLVAAFPVRPNRDPFSGTFTAEMIGYCESGDIATPAKILVQKLPFARGGARDAGFNHAVDVLAEHGGEKQVLDAIASLDDLSVLKLDCMLAVAAGEHAQHKTGAATAHFALAEHMAGNFVGKLLIVERARRAAGDAKGAAAVRRKAEAVAVGNYMDEVGELLRVDIECGDRDAARDLVNAEAGTNPIFRLPMLFMIAESYIAAGESGKALPLLEAAEKDSHVKNMSMGWWDPPVTSYHIAVDLRKTGDAAGAAARIKAAHAAAAAALQKAQPSPTTPLSVYSELLEAQIRAGDADGAADTLKSLNTLIDAEANVISPTVRLEQIDAYWRAGDEAGALKLVEGFKSPQLRLQGFVILADRCLDRAVPGSARQD
jgi:hypothetical protein